MPRIYHNYPNLVQASVQAFVDHRMTYLAIQQLIAKPSLRTSDFFDEFEDRHDQFYEQLKSLEQSIELGRL
ncbi:hypothetical protein [Novipirellula sp.]|uniref:hypothetical protein n=1 Tax=Novipirellula sp. TaxID=2795430 RepID=UPI003563FBC8